MYKMFKKSILFMIVLLFMVSLVSAVPRITTEFVGDAGYDIEANIQSYYKVNQGACVQIYVFNKSDGEILTNESVSCEVSLANDNGTELFVGYPTWHPNRNHFDVCRNGTIVTSQEDHSLTIVCNSSTLAGYKTAFFEANQYGTGLTEATSNNFNMGMIFLMILFLLGIMGLVKFDNPSGKLACYYVCHVLFIVGTFSMWQFNSGYNLGYLGLAGIYKVLFWVSTVALFPMVILSLAWIFWMHTVTEEIKDMMDRGMTSEEAWSRADKSGKSWFKW